MLIPPINNRFQAAGLHLLLSAVIFAALMSTLLLLWYPAPFFSASGGWQGLRLVAAVDVVLGPLLTLIVYNPRKPFRERASDLGIIITLQVSALAWGIFAVYQERPVAVAFWDEAFYTVPASAVTRQDREVSRLRQYGENFPVYVYVQPPQTPAESRQMLERVREEEVPPHEQTERYRPLQQHFEQVIQSNLDVQEIMAANSRMAGELEQLLEREDRSLESNYYIALISRYRSILLVFGQDGELLGHVSAPYRDQS